LLVTYFTSKVFKVKLDILHIYAIFLNKMNCQSCDRKSIITSNLGRNIQHNVL
jgi:hypothetical protein